ncbi:MAG TPA: dienelactone hydrolase family protein [Steroidobacteraceae bacterium]|jgi:dienelactone hydrolase|nr:dienelactone hydrolase family protein [Steroidobacteraceae bacterium]
MREQYIEYRDGETLLEGFLCYDEAHPGPRPAVLIAHAAGGRGDFVERKARRLAWQGYACFALDNYGKGKRGATPEENAALMKPFMNDRKMLLGRLRAGLETASSMPIIDSRRIAIMGFCFGGLCALDLARSNADIRGAVSFHGLLKPSGLTEPKIRAKVLMMHGYDDPLAPPEDVLAVAREFTDAGADWQLHAYGHTVHAFTNPAAHNRAGGLQYDEAADRRSWHALEEFLAETLK